MDAPPTHLHRGWRVTCEVMFLGRPLVEVLRHAVALTPPGGGSDSTPFFLCFGLPLLLFDVIVLSLSLPPSVYRSLPLFPALSCLGRGRPGCRCSRSAARGHLVPAQGGLLRHLADGVVVAGARARFRAGDKRVRRHPYKHDTQRCASVYSCACSVRGCMI